MCKKRSIKKHWQDGEIAKQQYRPQVQLMLKIIWVERKRYGNSRNDMQYINVIQIYRISSISDSDGKDKLCNDNGKIKKEENEIVRYYVNKKIT